MTPAASTEIEELSGRVLGIIGAYEMGTALDARDVDRKSTAVAPPTAPPPEPVLVPGEGCIGDGM